MDEEQNGGRAENTNPGENADIWAERENQFRAEIARRDAVIAEKDKIIRQLMQGGTTPEQASEEDEEAKMAKEIADKINQKRRY